MECKAKCIIGGIELTETAEEGMPYIKSLIYRDNACSSRLEIGAAASDSIEFTIVNPFKKTFDGDRVEFYVSYTEEDEPDKVTEIEEETGTQTTDEVINDDEDDESTFDGDEDDEDEDEEEPDDDDIADAEAEEAELDEGLDKILNGEEPEDGDDPGDGEEETEDTADPEDADDSDRDSWQQVGVFYAFSQTNDSSGKTINLTCYDGFSQMTGAFVPSAAKATIQEMFDDLRTQVLSECGITIDEYEFDYSDEITWDILCSYRDAIGYFAGIIGGYAEFGEDGTLGMSAYGYYDSVLIKENLASYTEDSAGEMVVSGITCNTSNSSLEDKEIEAGTGQDLSFANPFVTESMLEDILQMYKGLRVTGATLSCTWDDTLDSGSLVRVFTEAEYENYLQLENSYEAETDATKKAETLNNMNNLGKSIIISSQVVTISGGDAITYITSKIDTESQNSNTPMSPMDAKFRNVQAEVVSANQLIAKKADIDFANVKVASIATEWVRDLFVQGGFIAKEGTVFNLVGVHINGDLIEANTVYADRLLLQGENGLYYALNVDALGKTTASTDEKYQKGIDGSVIVAHSITANELTVQNIVGTGGWINLSEGTFQYTNASTGNGITWDGETLVVYGDFILSSGKNLSETITDTVNWYYLSDSATELTGDEWSTEVPKWEDGKYIWQKTVTTKAGGETTESEPVCVTGAAGKTGEKGEDAINLLIDSSNGNLFKNASIATVLSVTIIQGNKIITTSEGLTAQFGSTAKLVWYQKPMGSEDWTAVDSADSRLNDGGFMFAINANDVNEKCQFRCELDV